MILAAQRQSLPYASDRLRAKDLVHDIRRRCVDIFTRDNVAAACGLFARMPKQTRCEGNARPAFDLRRYRSPVGMCRVILDVDADMCEGLAVIVDERSQQSLVIADAHRPASARLE